KSLNRTKIDSFKLSDSYTLEDIKNNKFKFCDISTLLNYKKIEVTSDLEFKINNGAVLDNIYNDNKVLFTKNNKPFALYEKNNNKYKIVFKF
ncbi:MAG: hypothetical protein PUC23_05120, partial [bacterium]|nr:hypothetical protein [bacterium]